MVLNSHSTDLSFHVHRSVSLWSSRCLSPILFYHLSPMENLSIARAHLAPFPSALFLYSASPLSLSLCVSLPSVSLSRDRDGETEARRKADKEVAARRYIWRTIRNFYQRKFRAVCPQSREDTPVLSLAHLQILFLFTFAAAEVGSCSRPILFPGTFRSCLNAISLDRETCDEVRKNVRSRIQRPR